MDGLIFQYLGQRGAGPEFINSLWASSREYGIPNRFLVSSKVNFSSELSFSTLEMPKSRLALYLQSKFSTPSIPLELLESKLPVIGLMAHPLDLRVLEKFKHHGKKIGVVVHDYPRHKGEFFPSNSFLRRYIDCADTIICLSNSVASQVSKTTRRPKIEVIQHPPFVFAPESVSDVSRIIPISTNLSSRPKLLIIGRLMPYTGVETFLQFWEKSSLHQLFDLRVVGRNAPAFGKNFTSVRKWLRHEELVEELIATDAILFPYREASQSGLVPMAILFNKIIFYTKTSVFLYKQSD
jgi:hypothetical protein